MPSNGIQVPVTGEITPTALTDVYSVTNPYWGLGGLRNVTDLVDRDAITVNRREAGMLAYVASNGHYYKLEPGLTNLNWTDLGTSLGGGGYAPAIVRDVYLVGDASDATRMGGSANNTYAGATGFQDAYNAAQAIITAVGGNIVVNINVGVTGSISSLNAATSLVGNVTLTAAWNPRIRLIGRTISSSILGDIIGTNATGNAFGLVAGSGPRIFFANVNIRDIICTATGTTGNGAIVQIDGFNNTIRNIFTDVTNVANTTGNGGSVTLIGNNFTISAILRTSSKATTSTAGSLSLSGNNINISNCTLAASNLLGTSGISITGFNIAISILSCVTTNNTPYTFAPINNLTVSSTLTLSFPSSAVGIPLKMTNCLIGTANITHNLLGSLVNPLDVIMNMGIVTQFNTNLLTKLTAMGVNFYNNQFGAPVISNLGAFSRLINCVVIQDVSSQPAILGANIGCFITNTKISSKTSDGINTLGSGCTISNSTISSVTQCINEIGSGCRIVNCALLDGPGIENSSPVDVNVSGSYLEYGIVGTGNVNCQTTLFSGMPISQPDSSIASAPYAAGGGTPLNSGDTWNGLDIGQLFQLLLDYNTYKP